MRNLKKILALVLALVMSLSLVTVASAAETTAADGYKYQTAADVLKGLSVVVGDAGTGALRLDEPIIRGEAAALIYRVHSGDVKNEKVSLHDYNPFSDVYAGDWYLGYISYTQNQGIIRGDGNGEFRPGKNITGYEALAMTLRAMGYGEAKYGEYKEFEGPEWYLRTASRAQQIGLLNGVSAADQTDYALNQPATRGFVFQIMFNAMMLEEVQYSALYPYDYPSKGTTLGQRNFDLEEVTGVIKANEWANLDGAKVLSAGTTKMTVSSTKPVDNDLIGKDVTLDAVASEDAAEALNAVGMSYTAYMGKNKEGVKVALTNLVEADNTKAYNNGEPTTVGKLAGSMEIDNGTEYYVNYKEAWYEGATSKIIIRYAIAEASAIAYDAANGTKWVEYLEANKQEIRNVTLTGESAPVKCYVVRIRPNTDITATDLDIMQEIFYTADRIGTTTDNDGGALKDYVIGEVYTGTSSMKDESDTKSWDEFCDEYLDSKKIDKNEAVKRGNSLRIIDNDKDGVAEYILRIDYTQTKAVDTYKGELAFLGGLKMADYSGNTLYNPNELTAADMGVIVNYAEIDNKLYIYEAVKLTEKITAKNYRIPTVTTESGETLYESDIDNDTGLQYQILLLPEKTTYNLYLDLYRNIRSYEQVADKQYALLTEVYDEVNQNWNYVKTPKVTVEAVLATDEANAAGKVDVDEYPGSSAGVFYSTVSGHENAWTSCIDFYSRNDRLNFLQPATAHLGIKGNVYAGSTVGTAALYTDTTWKRDIFQAVNIGTVPSPEISVFNYGRITYVSDPDTDPLTTAQSNGSFTFTNVAQYVENEDDSLTLSTASKVYINQDGNEIYRTIADRTFGDVTVKRYETRTEAEWKALYGSTAAFDAAVANGDIYLVYATDYVQLSADGNMVSNGNRHFAIASAYDTKYNALSNTYVDTLEETVFYIVTPSTVYRQVGFTNLTAWLSSINDSGALNSARVRAAYAVAQNVSMDANKQDYWVADVVVVEIDSIGGAAPYDSIALMFNNPSEYSGGTQNVWSLDNDWRALQPDSDLKAQMTISPRSTSWANQSWTETDYGFYYIFGQDEAPLATEGEMSAGSIARIPYGSYNASGIYAGVIRRNKETPNSRYIDVEVVGKDSGGSTTAFTVKYDEWSTPIYRITSGTNNTATELYLTNYEPTNGVYHGDRVIVVMKGNTVAFIVDLGPNDLSMVGIKAVYNIPSWLDEQWWMVAIEQTFDNVGGTETTADDATVANLDAAVDVLTDAIMNDNYDLTGETEAVQANVANLVKVLREDGKGYDPYVNTGVNAITAENLTDLEAGLTGVKNACASSYEATIRTDITNVKLAQAAIPAIKTVKDAETAAKAKLDPNSDDYDNQITAIDGVVGTALAGIADATDKAGIDTAIENIDTKIANAVTGATTPDPEPTPEEPKEGVQIPEELEDKVETEPEDPEDVDLGDATVMQTADAKKLIDEETETLGEIVNAETVTVQPAAFTGRTLEIPYTTDAGEIPVVSKAANPEVQSVKVVPNTTTQSLDVTDWLIVITLKSKNTLPESEVVITVVTVEIVDKPEANVAVEAATLHDNAESSAIPDDELCSNYRATQSGDTVTIVATGLKSHINNADPKAPGYWVGLAVVLDDDQPEVWTQVKYAAGNNTPKTINIENLGEQGRGIAMYWNYSAATLSKGTTFTVTFLTAEGVESSTVTYNVVFDVSTAA